MADTFTIQAQRQLRYWDDNTGRLVDGMEVTFAISDGETGTVRIPLAQYTPDTVRQAVEARVATMLAVRNL